jgi:hypothetical protein
MERMPHTTIANWGALYWHIHAGPVTRGRRYEEGGEGGWWPNLPEWGSQEGGKL